MLASLVTHFVLLAVHIVAEVVAASEGIPCGTQICDIQEQFCDAPTQRCNSCADICAIDRLRDAFGQNDCNDNCPGYLEREVPKLLPCTTPPPKSECVILTAAEGLEVWLKVVTALVGVVLLLQAAVVCYLVHQRFTQHKERTNKDGFEEMQPMSRVGEGVASDQDSQYESGQSSRQSHNGEMGSETSLTGPTSHQETYQPSTRVPLQHP